MKKRLLSVFLSVVMLLSMVPLIDVWAAAADVAEEPQTGSLVIQVPLLMDDGINAPKDAIFTVTGPNDFSQEISYSEFMMEQVYTLENVPVGEYTVVESNAEREGYALVTNYVVNGAATNVAAVSAGQITTVSITNQYTRQQETGNLTVYVLAPMDAAAAPKDTIFTVTGPNDFSQEISYSEFVQQAYTLYDLPVGEYTVVESNAERDNYKLVTTYKVNGVETNVATVPAGDTTTVCVQNDYWSMKGKLNLQLVTFENDQYTYGNAIPNTAIYTVTGPDGYSKEIAGSEFNAQGCYTLGGLLVGGEYTVVESNAERDGYTLKTIYRVENKETNTVTIFPSNFMFNGPTIFIENCYTKQQETGNLTIKVPLLMDDGVNAPKDAIFTVKGPEGYSKKIPYSEFMEAQSYTLENLPVGEYTVAIDNAERDGYTLETSYTVNGEAGNKVLVAANEEAVITVQNAYTAQSSGGGSGSQTTYPGWINQIQQPVLKQTMILAYQILCSHISSIFQRLTQHQW